MDKYQILNVGLIAWLISHEKLGEYDGLGGCLSVTWIKASRSKRNLVGYLVPKNYMFDPINRVREPFVLDDRPI